MSSCVAAFGHTSKLVVPFDVALPLLQETINDDVNSHNKSQRLYAGRY